MSTEPRTKTLRLALGETQDQFAARIGVSQGTVYRLENGQAETGAQRILLDQIERLIAAAPPSPAPVPASAGAGFEPASPAPSPPGAGEAAALADGGAA